MIKFVNLNLKFSLVIQLLDFLSYWCQAGLDWHGEKLSLIQSLVFYYLQVKKFIPTISSFFTKDWVLPVESYQYGVLLANTDFLTWQSEYYKIDCKKKIHGPWQFLSTVIQEKRQKFAEYTLESFECVPMEDLVEIAVEFFKYFAEEKSIMKYELNAFSAAHYSREFQDE